MLVVSQNSRFEKTIQFLSRSIDKDSIILDLGIENDLSKFIRKKGFNISNTSGEDLDTNFEVVKSDKFNVVTAFEIFEHMFCPFNLLKEIKADILIASVPLKLWFSGAYWNKNDDRDKHYHEFEIKQFDFLLRKTGWEIVAFEKWKSASFNLGIRPILRLFFPRYYIVYCVRSKN